jgi:hypothetical protein
MGRTKLPKSVTEYWNQEQLKKFIKNQLLSDMGKNAHNRNPEQERN